MMCPRNTHMFQKSVVRFFRLTVLFSFFILPACDNPTLPVFPKFQQKIEVLGLPEGVNADITVTGPNNFKQVVTKTTVLDNLEYGEYIVSVKDVFGEPSYFF
jgi:hypothetical protein